MGSEILKLQHAGKNARRATAIGSYASWSQIMAEWTGLEPATPGVTGRYSNQLNYHSRLYDMARLISWWVLRESNPRLSPCKGDALTC